MENRGGALFAAEKYVKLRVPLRRCLGVVCIKGGLAPSGKLPGGCESLIVVPPGRKRERGDAS